jgi:hypothetical protein
VSSTFEQQDAAVGGEDGINSGDTSAMPYPAPVETRYNQPQNLAVKSSQKESLYYFFSKYKDKGKLDSNRYQ